MKHGALNYQVLRNPTGPMKTILVVQVQAALTTCQPRALEQSTGTLGVSPGFLLNNVESSPASQVVGMGRNFWLSHNLLAGGSQS